MGVKLWNTALVAKHAGVSRQAVMAWIRRADFPAPIAEIPENARGTVLLWAPSDIEAWLADRAAAATATAAAS